jgi:hypothetical protein
MSRREYLPSWGVVDDVRTFSQTGKKRWFNRLIKETATMRHTEHGQRILDNIRTLRQFFEQDAVKELRSCRRGGAS